MNSSGGVVEIFLLNGFLAHLAQSAKVSFWDDPLSVVRRCRASSVVNNLLNPFNTSDDYSRRQKHALNA